MVRFGDFEWDARKAAANIRNHGITFQEATTIFSDPLSLTKPDARHPDRFIVLGVSRAARTLFVVYAERDGETFRIISARRATAHERKAYENE